MPSTKTAIVTGASRGIGAAVAARLAADGFAVIVNFAGRAGDAEAQVAYIRSAGGEATAVQADVSDLAAMREMFDRAEETYGGVDVLVNNAGIMQLSTIAEADDAFFDRHIVINLKGVFNGMRLAARRIKSGGRIISFSSSVVGLYQPTYGVYAATKGGVEAMTHVLANEMRVATSRSTSWRRVRPATDSFSPRQDASADRSLEQACTVGTPRPARRHRGRRFVSRWARWRVGEWPSAARQWRDHLKGSVAMITARQAQAMLAAAELAQVMQDLSDFHSAQRICRLGGHK